MGWWLTASVISMTIAGLLAGYFHIENSNLGEELKSERVHSESLFSNKVVLQKELEGLRREIGRLEYEGKTAKAEIDRLKALLAAGEAVLWKKDKQYAADTEALRLAKQEASQHSTQMEELTDKLYSLQEVNDQLRLEVSELKQIETALQVELQTSKKARASYFRIEALHGKKNIETNKARKTDRVLVSFTWPEASYGRNLYLVLSGPDKQIVGNPAKEQVSILLEGTHQRICPTASRRLDVQNHSQRQEIMLEIPQKLKAGMYQADVYTDDFHLGGTQIRLE